MKKQLDQLETFQVAFNSEINYKPTNIKEEVYELRHKLLEEENREYLEACKENDLVEIADALGDQLYIVLGTIVSHGLQNIIKEVFEEIHNSNMSKLDNNGKPIINGENGAFDYDRPLGKVLKSKNYKAPNISKILKIKQ
jgi:predicted HAD superfamily Cof-like phosphohydrolase